MGATPSEELEAQDRALVERGRRRDRSLRRQLLEQAKSEALAEATGMTNPRRVRAERRLQTLEQRLAADDLETRAMIREALARLQTEETLAAFDEILQDANTDMTMSDMQDLIQRVSMNRDELGNKHELVRDLVEEAVGDMDAEATDAADAEAEAATDAAADAMLKEMEQLPLPPPPPKPKPPPRAIPVPQTLA